MPCALQLSKSSSLCVLRRLAAPYHRARPATAAGGGRSSQEKHSKLRSPTSRCTVAASGAYWPCWSASNVGCRSAPPASGWSWTIPELVRRLGRLGTNRRRVGRISRRVCVKVTTCGSPRRGPRLWGLCRGTESTWVSQLYAESWKIWKALIEILRLLTALDN